MTTTALPESEASRILRVDPAGLAQLVRAGHLTATLAPDGYRFTPEQVHALQPRAAGLVASLQSEVEQARRARAKAQLEQAKGLQARYAPEIAERARTIDLKRLTAELTRV